MAARANHSVLSAPLELCKGEHKFCLSNVACKANETEDNLLVTAWFQLDLTDTASLPAHLSIYHALSALREACEPCFHFPTSDHLAFPDLSFRAVAKLSSNLSFYHREQCRAAAEHRTAACRSALSEAVISRMPAPPSGLQSQHTQAFTELLSQNLLDGSEVLTYGPGFNSKIQSCL